MSGPMLLVYPVDVIVEAAATAGTLGTTLCLSHDAATVAIVVPAGAVDVVLALLGERKEG